MGDEVSTTAVDTEQVTDSEQTTTVTNESEVVTDNTVATDDTGNADDATPVDTSEEGSQKTPDTYADFSLPEGMQLDEALLSEATPLFKELGLTQEQAQKLVDFQAKQIQAGSQSQIDAFNQVKNQWLDDTKNDKEIGGDKFDENVKVAQLAVSKYGTPELKQMLEDHGIGNHPEVVRFMVKVGREMAEDVPDESKASVTTQTDRISLLYPNDRNDN